MKSFQVMLPVFKQGDDMYCAEKAAKEELAKTCEGEVKADVLASRTFALAADQYEAAAAICRRLAGAARETYIELAQADTHLILIRAEEAAVQGLVADGILDSDPFGEDEDEEAIEGTVESEDLEGTEDDGA
jgi:hypothetical protein